MANSMDFSLVLRAQTQQFRNEIAAAREELRRLNQELGGGVGGNGGSGGAPFNHNPIAAGISSIGTAAAGLVAGAVGFVAIKNGIQSVIDATMQMQAIRTRFEYAFGGAEEGARQLEFVRETANKLGLEFTNTANGYAQLSAATKDLNITNEQTQQIFTGVASAAAAMGLSADDTSGVILALSQIAGKGKVSMEELRGQLGERLTPAMSIAAKSMGVTTAELEKMVEKGLSAEEFLPKFGAALEEAFGGAAKTNIESLGGQINLLKNRFNELLVLLGDSGIAKAVGAVVGDIGNALDWLHGKIVDTDFSAFKEAFSEAYNDLKPAFDDLVSTGEALFGVVNDVANAFGLMGDVPADLEPTEQLVMRLTQGVQFLSGAANGAFSAFLFIGSILAASFGRAMNVVYDAALMLRQLGYISEETFKQIGKARDSAFEAADTLFEKSANAMKRATTSMSKAFADQTGAVKSAAEQQSDAAKTAYQAAAAEAESKAKQAADAQKAAMAVVGTTAESTAKVQAMNAQLAADVAQEEAEKAKMAWQVAYAAIDDKELAQRVAAQMQHLGVATSQAAAQAEKLDKGFKDAQAAAMKLGLDLEESMNRPSRAMFAMIDSVQVLYRNLDELKANGVNTGLMMKNAFDKMLEGAKSKEDIKAIEKALKEMGDKGVLSVSQVADVTDALSDKMKKLPNEVDAVTQAFGRMGVKSKEELAKIAKQMQDDYKLIKESGRATAEELDKAFEKAAKAQLAAGDSAATAWAKSEAAMRGYDIATDGTVSKMKTAEDAAKSLGNTLSSTGESGVGASVKRTTALEHEIDAVDRLASAYENAGNKSAYQNSMMAANQTAKTGTFNKQTWLSAFNQAKSWTGSDEAAKLIADKAEEDYKRRLANSTSSLGDAFITWKGLDMNFVRKEAENWLRENVGKKDATMQQSVYTPADVGANKSYQPPVAEAGVASGKTVNVNLSLGGQMVNTTMPASQQPDLEAILKQLNQARILAGK